MQKKNMHIRYIMLWYHDTFMELVNEITLWLFNIAMV